jgi:hypothetical protein
MATSNKSANTDKIAPARILCDTRVDDIPYKVNQVVAFPGGQINALKNAGVVDPHPDSVAYALSLGTQVIEHEVASSEESDDDSDADAAAAAAAAANQDPA